MIRHQDVARFFPGRIVLDSEDQPHQDEEKPFIDIEAPLILHLTGPGDAGRLIGVAAFALIEGFEFRDFYHYLLENDPDSRPTLLKSPVDGVRLRSILGEISDSDAATDNPIASFISAVAALGAAWSADGCDANSINAVFVMTNSEEPSANPITLQTKTEIPLWIMESGSIKSQITTLVGAVNPARWALLAFSTVRRLFTSAHEASTWFRDALRQRGEHHEVKPGC